MSVVIIVVVVSGIVIIVIVHLKWKLGIIVTHGIIVSWIGMSSIFIKFIIVFVIIII